MAATGVTVEALDEVRGQQKPDDVGIGEWIWGALQGDFNPDRSVGQIGTDMVVSLLPVVDTVCDLRDLCANVQEYKKDPANKIVWFTLATTVVGFFPELGTVAKSALRIVWVYLKPLIKHVDELTNASKLIQLVDRAFDAALPKITEYLQHNRVVQWATNSKIVDMYKFVAKLVSDLVAKVNPSALARLLKEKLDNLKGLLQKIRHIVPGHIRDRVDDMIKFIEAKSRPMIDIIQKPVQWIRTCLNRVAKRMDDHAWRVEIYRTNRGWIAPMTESGAAKLMNAKRPNWVKKFKGWLPYPEWRPETVELEALAKKHPDHMPLAEWLARTFSSNGKARASYINGPAKLYRIVDPTNEGAGMFWISEKEFKALKNRDEWRSRFAVKPDWNQNGWFVEYEVKAGDSLPVWRGPAASQKLQGTDYYLEGGGEQIVFGLKNRDEMVQGLPRVNEKTGELELDRRVEFTTLTGEKIPAKIRHRIVDPNIRGPIETGWGATEYSVEEAKQIMLTVP